MSRDTPAAIRDPPAGATGGSLTKTLVLSAALLTALGATGFADVVYATGNAGFTFSEAAYGAGVFTDTGTALTSAGTDAVHSAPNGVYFFVYGNTIGDRYKITVSFAPGADNGSLTLYTGHFESITTQLQVSLTNVQWTGGTAPGNQNVSLALASAAIDGDWVQNTIHGIGWSSDFTGLVLDFTTVGGGDNSTFKLDAISNSINPEPGTMTLFALGAAGLGGFVWRRRGTRRPAFPAR